MNRQAYLAPSLLSADFMHLADEIAAVEAHGADILHLDIMDGHFVPNLTFGPPLIRQIKKITRLPLDVHLMITNAESTLDEYIDAGADWISVHTEAVNHLQRTLSYLRSKHVKAGAALNPATPLSVLEYVWEDVDYILLMSVNPGFGGQAFIPSVMDKIRLLARERAFSSHENVLIEVDGGIQQGNIEKLYQAGVDIFVAGSAIFHNGEAGKHSRELKRFISRDGKA